MSDTAAARAYAELEPIQFTDDGTLLSFVTALVLGFQDIWSLVMQDANEVAWGALLDVDRAPVDALPYLAQFLGTRLVQGSSVAEQRTRIRYAPGLQRGTVAAMTAAIKETLTGTKSVFLYERTTSAWTLGVSTYTSETPDTAATIAAINSQKPVGIVMSYAAHSAGPTWGDIRAAYATWTLLRSAKATYDAMRT